MSDVALEAALQAMMDDGEIVLQAVAAIVHMDQDGQKMISHKVSTDLRTWEARGLVKDMDDALQGYEFWRQMEDDDD